MHLIITKHDSLHYDQLAGKYMKAILDSNQMKSIYINGNAETLYFPNEVTIDSISQEKIKTIKGLNHMISSEIWLLFEKSEIQNIRFVKDADASFFPIENIDRKELFLKKFNWKINLKPESLLKK